MKDFLSEKKASNRSDDRRTSRHDVHTVDVAIHRLRRRLGQATPVVRTGSDYVHGLEIAPRPRLNLTVQNGQLTLTWPGWSMGHVLESSASPGAEAFWTPVPTIPINFDDRYTATLHNVGPQQFFRLVKQ